MNLKEIRQLLKMVESLNISELEIEEDGKKLRISKNFASNNGPSNASNVNMMPVPAVQAIPPALGAAPLPVPVEEPPPPAAETPAPNIHEVRSPMVGTFYRAPSPDADPYVKVGNTVSEGQILCIVEAMKLMNEIESETSGKIVKILVENAQPVEYNQVLFLVEAA